MYCVYRSAEVAQIRQRLRLQNHSRGGRIVKMIRIRELSISPARDTRYTIKPKQPKSFPRMDIKGHNRSYRKWCPRFIHYLRGNGETRAAPGRKLKRHAVSGSSGELRETPNMNLVCRERINRCRTVEYRRAVGVLKRETVGTYEM